MGKPCGECMGNSPVPSSQLQGVCHCRFSCLAQLPGRHRSDHDRGLDVAEFEPQACGAPSQGSVTRRSSSLESGNTNAAYRHRMMTATSAGVTYLKQRGTSLIAGNAPSLQQRRSCDPFVRCARLNRALQAGACAAQIGEQAASTARAPTPLCPHRHPRRPQAMLKHLGKVQQVVIAVLGLQPLLASTFASFRRARRPLGRPGACME